MNIIFLISLPRSGSTLLQRLLATSPDICTVSEPWLMLPLSSLVENKYTQASYNHGSAFNAVQDFIQSLQNKHKDFYKALENFILSLYSNASDEKEVMYFLDKTPRYYMILKFLADIFPSAKFIFLFRNPLEVMASILSSWTGNKFFLYRFYIDLYFGPYALVEGYKSLKKNAIRTTYQNLLDNPDKELKKICSFLNIQHVSSMASDFINIKLNGRMGDKQGIYNYEGINTEPLEKWKEILNTSYRKIYAKRYIKYLGDDVLSYFGTDKTEMLKDIASIQNIRRGSLNDFFYHSISTIKRYFNTNHYKTLIHSIKERKIHYPYL